MTKRELATMVATDTGISVFDAENAIDSMTHNIKAQAAQGEGTFIRGFGTFAIKSRKAKIARDITRGKSIQMPARNIVQFKPAPGFVAKQAR